MSSSLGTPSGLAIHTVSVVLTASISVPTGYTPFSVTSKPKASNLEPRMESP